jgi:succinate dehydrogenase/fumarate reductase-like Fe-S protein
MNRMETGSSSEASASNCIRCMVCKRVCGYSNRNTNLDGAFYAVLIKLLGRLFCRPDSGQKHRVRLSLDTREPAAARALRDSLLALFGITFDSVATTNS